MGTSRLTWEATTLWGQCDPCVGSTPAERCGDNTPPHSNLYFSFDCVSLSNSAQGKRSAGQGQANRRRALKAIPATGRPGPLRAASSLQSSYEAPSDICPINKPDASHLDYYTEPRTMPHGLALIWPTSAYQPPCRWADRDTQEHTTSGPRTRTLVCSS